VSGSLNFAEEQAIALRPMADNDAVLWNHVPPKRALPTRTREPLFPMTKGSYRLAGC
jgi:hypothetical protein